LIIKEIEAQCEKDKSMSIREANEEKFKRITAAYEVLSNAEKK